MTDDDHGVKLRPKLKIQLRVGGGVIGPGKIELLEHLDAQGGITAAAKAMGLSYRRAWYLIDTMNSALGNPVVETKVGGEGGGGAKLTPFGSALVHRYRSALAAVDEAAEPFLDWLADGVEASAREH
ncbi:MAG: LysR family transcriptional regulator [Rhodospirillaceae bacterium]|nr:LysR family transcriptional regulator [Rhodospirillaceae bacterium]